MAESVCFALQTCVCTGRNLSKKHLPMKQLSKLLLAAICFSSPFAAHSQAVPPVPCLSVNSDFSISCPPDETAETTVIPTATNLVQYQVSEADATLQRNPGARYKAFWLLGDGNFRFFPYGDLPQDLSTYAHSYVYRAADTYKPMVVLSERKSNTSPPRNLQRTIGVPNTSTPVRDVDTFAVRLHRNKSLDIFNHDRNRPHYPTVFVVSAPKEDKLIDSVFFFYNGEKKADGTYNAKKIHEYNFVNFPNYFKPTPLANEFQMSAGVPGCLNVPAVRNILTGRFLNYLGVRTQSGQIVVERSGAKRAVAARQEDPAFNPFDETRFFPSLTSIWDTRWITGNDTLLPVGHYLAVSVGYQPLSRVLNPDRPNEINPVFADVLRYFPELDSNTLQIGQEKYIRGIATTDVEMVASIDPNGLQILQICPDGQNRFKVTIRMEVCNEGFMHEQDFGFGLIDHTGVISKPEFIAGTSPNFLEQVGNEWKYKWNVFLDGVPLPEATKDELQEARKLCDTLVFTVTTNWLGVQRLTKGQGLELCVQFSHAREECHKNYALDEREVSPLTGFKCGDPPAAPWMCCLPVYITLALAIIILLLLIWIAWKLRRHFA